MSRYAIFLGIDPGKKGALAIIQNSEIKIFPCPVINVVKGKNKLEYLVNGMVDLLKCEVLSNWNANVVFCAIEKVHAMQGQGVSSMFAMGVGFGLWQGILSGLSIPHELVTPQRWQKEMIKDIPGDDQKAKAIIMAKRLFPNVNLKRTLQSRKDDDGFADALLLAAYASKVDKCNQK